MIRGSKLRLLQLVKSEEGQNQEVILLGRLIRGCAKGDDLTPKAIPRAASVQTKKPQTYPSDWQGDWDWHLTREHSLLLG